MTTSQGGVHVLCKRVSSLVMIIVITSKGRKYKKFCVYLAKIVKKFLVAVTGEHQYSKEKHTSNWQKIRWQSMSWQGQKWCVQEGKDNWCIPRRKVPLANDKMHCCDNGLLQGLCLFVGCTHCNCMVIENLSMFLVC